MALKLYDRVLEFTTSTGTSSFELSNESPSGFTTFQSGVGHGIGTYYSATHQTEEEWEEYEYEYNLYLDNYEYGHTLYDAVVDIFELGHTRDDGFRWC